MPRNRNDTVRILAENWSAPVTTAPREAGRPLICIASTYTFHAPFLESELLPRFLGLKFDETEGVRPFVVEREQALATARVCVLVDANHFDPSQTTLRWDQLPVRVPGGAQHSKVVMLIWENFFDDENSAPRRLILDAIAFLQDVSSWVRASEAARGRLQGTLEDARARVRSWRQMPAYFKPRERPRVTFVGGLPGPRRGVARSPIQQMLELWGTRRVSEVTVMTPFVGDLVGTADPVVEKLLELPRTRETIGYLIVPGNPSEDETRSLVVGLPRRFLEAWSSAWRIDPSKAQTYVVPLCREGEPANRDLHAKGVLLAGDGAAMLFCGSSNFSPHGMGVGVANVEANLCYLDDHGIKRDGMRLEDRLPVDWDKDFCEGPIWPETAKPIEDESEGPDRPLPLVFLWAVYNQYTSVLTVAVDPKAEFPSEWSLRWPGEHPHDAAPLADHRQFSQPPPEGRIVLPLPASLRGANIAGLRLEWRDDDGVMQSATLPVHVESTEHLLPPKEFRSLTAGGIVNCLLSGREPAEWVEALERRQMADAEKGGLRDLDSLRAVDTSAYVLYRTRRFGAALAALGERLQRTVRTRDAIAYRLRQDPLGPRMFAEALVREWRDAKKDNGERADGPAVLLFNLAEIKLVLAHVARRIADERLRPVFRETIDEIDRHCIEIASGSEPPPPNLLDYLKAVNAKTDHLLGGTSAGTAERTLHAG